MRAILFVCLVAILVVPAYGVSVDELGLRLDFGPDPIEGNGAWMTTFGVYGDLSFTGGRLLRLSLRVPIDHWIPHLGFELAWPFEPMLAIDAALHAAAAPAEDLSAVELDLGLRALLIDSPMWHVSFAAQPLALLFRADGGSSEGNLLLGLNLAADLSLCIADQIVFGQHLRIAILESRPFGEPLFPVDETFGVVTHVTLFFGRRIATSPSP